MTFIQACSNAILKAKDLGVVHRVYRIGNSDRYDAERDYPTGNRRDWLFMAYPGGRKELSMAGVKVCNELGIKLNS